MNSLGFKFAGRATIGAWLVALVLSLTGCFGGGASDAAVVTPPAGGGGTVVVPQSIPTLVLLTEDWQLKSGESSSVRITANLRDANNVFVANEPITFAATSGSLQIVQATTDTLGNAVAILSTPNDPVKRSITVTATAMSGLAKETVAIEVVGTEIQFSGPASAIAAGTAADIGIKLTAGDGSVLGNRAVTLSSALGNGLSSSTVITDKQGEATFRVTDTHGGNDVITATALNGTVSKTYQLRVSSDGIVFVSPTNPAEVNLNTDRTVSVQMLVAGSPSPNQAISFSSTRGEFVGGVATATTNAQGIASVAVRSATAGLAMITASTGNETATMPIEFVATTPTMMVLESAPRIVSIGSKSTVTATLRDANQNLVKNQKVKFNLVDFTEGSLSLGEVITNSLGQASTVYTAGIQASGENNVQVTAVVQNFPTVTQTVRMTVDPQNVRITFGTGNLLHTPNDAQYSKPYVIQVNDNGVPVTNATVQISVYPKRYMKGYYVPSANSNGDPVAPWVPLYTINTGAGECRSEDVNRNGILDPGEDDPLNGGNNDSLLTPPPVVTISESNSLAPTVSKATVTTDSNGFGYFNITYPRDQAHWLEVELIAQTSFAGRESTFKSSTVLQVLGDDVNDLTKAPPGSVGIVGGGFSAIVSPYGTSNVCTDTL
ncbi:MAG: hypothetical protein ACFCUG_13970 [Thiotrichales bacterium]